MSEIVPCPECKPIPLGDPTSNDPTHWIGNNPHCPTCGGAALIIVSTEPVESS